jgi:hypothetical protein
MTSFSTVNTLVGSLSPLLCVAIMLNAKIVTPTKMARYKKYKTHIPGVDFNF